MLEINNLHKQLGTKNVLNGIKFNFDFGESIAILGKHATGKTVLLKTILGFTDFKTGTVLFNGKKITYSSQRKVNKFRSSIGYIAQENKFLDDVSIFQNIQWITSKSKEQIFQKSIEIGLSESLYLKIKDIPPYDKQLLKLVIVLLNSPKLIFVDEPMQHLTINEAQNFTDLLLRLSKKYSIGLLIVTHEVEIISAFDKKYILENGTLNEFI
jgi:ABC-type multidrug transport system ATPase subunit